MGNIKKIIKENDVYITNVYSMTCMLITVYFEFCYGMYKRVSCSYYCIL